MTPDTKLRVLARPQSSRESIVWDAWRSAWIVRVREPAVGGRANEAVLRLLARALGLDATSVRWLRAGTGSAKLAQVIGLSAGEVQRRLDEAGRNPEPPRGKR